MTHFVRPQRGIAGSKIIVYFGYKTVISQPKVTIEYDSEREKNLVYLHIKFTKFTSVITKSKIVDPAILPLFDPI